MPQLSDRRILVVEDEFLIALELRMIFEDEGAEVFDAASVADVHAVIETCANDGGLPDVAVLDVRLGDEEVFPVADDLVERGVPFVFHSGHAKADELTEMYPSAGVFSKPAEASRLVAALARRAIAA